MTTSNEPICPDCQILMEAQWENNGFTMPEGPEHNEITGFKCPQCGLTDEEID